ncbi:MAG: hypothetical protein RR365_10605 [Bacteroides sp.]
MQRNLRQRTFFFFETERKVVRNGAVASKLSAASSLLESARIQMVLNQWFAGSDLGGASVREKNYMPIFADYKQKQKKL